MILPAGWQIAWPEDDAGAESGTPSLSLREADHPERESFCLAFLEQGWAAWGLDGPPERARVELDAFPRLDAMWCLFMWVAEAAGGPAGQPAVAASARASWPALAQYAADVRQGFWPDQVPPEQAVQSIYQAIVHQRLVEADPQKRDRFVAEALALGEHVAGRVEGGASLLEARHFDDAPTYQRHVAMLRADRDLYREDVARGRRYQARLPARCSAALVERSASLLVLTRPTAQQLRDIKKGVPSRHIIATIDACYAGWTGAKGDDELDDKVRSLWRSRAEVILSAATRGERAWEDEEAPSAQAWKGHSALTAFVLRGLSPGEGGRAHAARNEDGIVTDEELSRYVKRELPGAVAQHKNDARQTPQFFRLDKGLLESGQFMFVPSTATSE